MLNAPPSHRCLRNALLDACFAVPGKPATSRCTHSRFACVSYQCVALAVAAVKKPVLACARRDLFGRCLREPGMVELVAAEVGGASTAASALAFTAAIGRDHGAVPQSLCLFRHVPVLP